MPDLARATRAQPVHLVLVALIGVVFMVGMASSDRFATLLNISNVQDQLVALAIVALAQTIVILSGGIDLSYAGALSFLSVVFAGFAGETGATLLLAICIVLALGIAIGCVNGAITAYVGVHPFIVTLGTSTILAGMALLITRQPSGSVPLGFEDFTYGRLLGVVPYGMIFVILLYMLVGVMLWRTVFGTRIFAIGDNEPAAAVSGLPVKPAKVAIYGVSGLFCAIAAIYITGRFGVGDPRAGVGFDLRSITPVIVGGTLLVGGKGGVLGTALAVVLLALLANVLNFMNVSSFYLWIAEGLIIIAAVSVFTGKARR